jgi:hypothetical protein
VNDPAAFRGIASRITPIPSDGFGIPPPELPRRDNDELSSPTWSAGFLPW